MNKPFNLEAFRNGQKALTRDGRVATFVAICEECEKLRGLVYRTYCNERCAESVFVISLEGNFYSNGMESILDLVSMVSRHQHLIDSYDPEDMWQISFDKGKTWRDLDHEIKEWLDTFDYRIHPHNDLIKAYKKGAKIEKLAGEFGKGHVDDLNPTWEEYGCYRIKPEPEFTYPIYKQSTTDKLVVKFTSLDTGEIIRVGSHSYEVGSTHSNFILHTNTDVWKDWTPLQDKPKTKNVYEWIHEANVGNVNYFVSSWVADEDVEYFFGLDAPKQKYKTGRSWEVEA